MMMERCVLMKLVVRLKLSDSEFAITQFGAPKETQGGASEMNVQSVLYKPLKNKLVLSS